MRYLLDTNTCIALMRNRSSTLQRVSGVSPAECAVSTVSAYELYTGVEKSAQPVKERAKVDRLLKMIALAHFEIDAAIEAARIRALLESQGQSIGPYDLLLAGQELSTSLTLVTANIREFQRVPGLVVEDWS